VSTAKLAKTRMLKIILQSKNAESIRANRADLA